MVIISDEDDCSVSDATMFDIDPELNTNDSVLGRLSSFRCFEFGVACNPDTPRVPGPRQECTPRSSSQFMPDVSDYADFLEGLKQDSSNIVVAGIIGNPTPVEVVIRNGRPKLDPSCSSSSGEADPAVRLDAFLKEFPERNTTTTICNEDLSDALTSIAERIASVLGS
ncbi:MAG: hypothetical protein GY811_03890 [Myxococcales bacterium]|nr:hypothetical protein [Myxococcales bacterium]